MCAQINDYALIRQRRKTVGLYIKNGGVEVRAPYGVQRSEIDKFVASKENWIKERLAAAKEREAKKQEFSVSYGSMILWRGKEYPILGDSDSDQIWRDENGFHFPAGMEDDEELKYNLIRLFKVLAGSYLTQRTQHFSELMGVRANAVKITEAKKRWGSCSRKTPVVRENPGSFWKLVDHQAAAPQKGASGEPVYKINYSWRLCMAEDDVIDAIVVHELAHIKEMNHSEAFYAIVKAVLPDYDERRTRLKALSMRLGGEDWEA